MGKLELNAFHSSIAWVLGFVFCQLALLAFTLIGATVSQIVAGNTENFDIFMDGKYAYLIQTIIMETVFVSIFIYFNKKSSEKLNYKVSPKKLIIYLAIAIAAFFCLYPIVNCVDSLLTKLGAHSNGIDISHPSDFVVGIFSLAILPAIGEELLFRGIITRGYKPYGKAVCVILSALSFAIFHLSPYQLVYPILFGMLLSIIMYKENNIIYTIAMHLTNNFLALAVAYFNIPLVFNHFSYIILAVVLVTIYLGLILYAMFFKNKGSKTQNFGKDKFWVIGAFSIMIVMWIVFSIVA